MEIFRQIMNTVSYGAGGLGVMIAAYLRRDWGLSAILALLTFFRWLRLRQPSSLAHICSLPVEGTGSQSSLSPKPSDNIGIVRDRADYRCGRFWSCLTMRQVGIAELKSRVSEYLRAVRRRETISVLDRETPVAQIVPVREKSRLDIRKPTPVSPPPNRVQLPKVRSEELPFWVRTRSLHFY